MSILRQQLGVFGDPVMYPKTAKDLPSSQSSSIDEVIEDKGVKVFIDAGAIMYLLGTEMDYKKEEFSSSFVFNP